MYGFNPEKMKSQPKAAGPGLGFKPRGAAQAQALNQAPDSIPAMVKPGEFVLPPDTVHAMGGPEALQGVVDATHTPAPRSAVVPRGFKPQAFFAQGGAVDDEANKQKASSFGDAAAANPAVRQVRPAPNSPSNTFPGNSTRSASGFSGAPVGRVAASAAAPAATGFAQRNPGASELYMQDRAQEMKDQWGQGQYAQAAGTAARTAVQGIGMYGLEAADKLATPVIDAARGFGRGLLGSDANVATVTPAARAPAAAPSSLAAGAQRGPMAPVSRPAAVSAPQALSSVVEMAKPAAPAFDFDTFQPQPGEGAFRNEQTGRVTRLQSEPAGTRQQLVELPRGLPGYVSGPQRQDVRAPVLNPNGGVFSSMVDFTNQAGQAMQAIAANKGMRNDRKDALDQQRVGLDAASTLAKIDQGYQSLGIDGRRADTAQDLAALQADELGLKREAAGFQTRAARRLEGLQTALMAEQDPSKRAAIARQIQELSGKGEGNLRDNFMVVGGGQEWDGQAGVMRNVPQRLVDLRTGREVGVPGQPQGQGGAAKPPAVGTVEQGYRFKGGDPASPASWEKV